MKTKNLSLMILPAVLLGTAVHASEARGFQCLLNESGPDGDYRSLELRPSSSPGKWNLWYTQNPNGIFWNSPRINRVKVASGIDCEVANSSAIVAWACRQADTTPPVIDNTFGMPIPVPTGPKDGFRTILITTYKTTLGLGGALAKEARSYQEIEVLSQELAKPNYDSLKIQYPSDVPAPAGFGAVTFRFLPSMCRNVR